MKYLVMIILYLVSLPADLLGMLAVLIVRAAWGENLRFETVEDRNGLPALACDLKPDSWPCRTWYRQKMGGEYVTRPEELVDQYGTWITWGGTTLAPHAVFYGPGQAAVDQDYTTEVQYHEHVHCEQGEAHMLSSAIVGLTVVVFGPVWLGILVWSTGYIFMGLGGWLTAALRGEEAYRGSYHEEAAYEITANRETW